MTLKTLFVSLAISTVVSAAPTPPQGDGIDIVGGTAAAAGEFPFIVSLQQSGSHFCGGSLLNANTVISAAHCAVDQDPSTIKIRAGSLSRSSGGTLVGVTQIIINPGYDSNTMTGDVSIWKLDTPIPASSTVGYAKLPATGFEPSAGTVLTVAGWGTTSEGASSLPTKLLKVSVPVVDHATCQQEYGSSTIPDDQFCAGYTQGGKDSCQGDSGGPIVDSSKTLVGLVSWGNGCAEANFPGVYADVGDNLSFITSNS